MQRLYSLFSPSNLSPPALLTIISSPLFPLPSRALPPGQSQNYFASQQILPLATTLTIGTKKETVGRFSTAPVTLFSDKTGQCGIELAFNVTFSFTLSPRASGGNGFAFVISAVPGFGGGAGVGYLGMDNRSMAVEFDTLENVAYGDMRRAGGGNMQHVGLNIGGSETSIAAVESPFLLNSGVFLSDRAVKPVQALLERRLSLSAVLQGTFKQQQQQQLQKAGVLMQGFYFGFVASTTSPPFQQLVIRSSNVNTGKNEQQRPAGEYGKNMPRGSGG
ncbi:unnamed protein product [Closterium sp. NIES-54]